MPAAAGPLELRLNARTEVFAAPYARFQVSDSYPGVDNLMNIRFLESFIWLTRLKSFRATAEKLNTTQPNISARVAALEEQLRVKLYDRGAKEFTPTAAGRRLFEYAAQILELSNRMQKEICVTEENNTVLRVGIIELITLSWLPQLIQAIRSSDMMTEVDFVTESSSSLIQSLRRDEIDLAFIWGPANEANIENEYICNYSMEWLGNPRFSQGLESMDVIDVARLPVITSKKEASDYRIVKEYFAAYGIDSTSRFQDRVALSSYSLGTSLHLIRAGLGVMAMAPLMMANELRDGSVAILPVKQPLPPICLTACYKSVNAPSAVARLVRMAQVAATAYSALVGSWHFEI
jgi:DNA-binding transcriptional LysR family regulator